VSGRPLKARAPGRVNLIGDHTDYNAGLALPIATDLSTEALFTPIHSSPTLLVRSDAEPGAAQIDITTAPDPEELRSSEPRWARNVAGVIAALRPECGGTVQISSTLPVGSGMASSAAVEIAVALSLGFEADPLTLARTCQRAEQVATGVPCGLLDQLAIVEAEAGHAILIDFSALSREKIPVPVGAEVVVAHSGESRLLDRTDYANRRAECEAASLRLGPLGVLSPGTEKQLHDPLLRRRARHVISECERVRNFAAALAQGDLRSAGSIMNESHVSLAGDFEVSTPALDHLVDHLLAMPGLFGARLTGAGFGGCVVALAEPGAIDTNLVGARAWRIIPSRGAAVI